MDIEHRKCFFPMKWFELKHFVLPWAHEYYEYQKQYKIDLNPMKMIK